MSYLDLLFQNWNPAIYVGMTIPMSVAFNIYLGRLFRSVLGARNF